MYFFYTSSFKARHAITLLPTIHCSEGAKKNCIKLTIQIQFYLHSECTRHFPYTQEDQVQSVPESLGNLLKII